MDHDLPGRAGPEPPGPQDDDARARTGRPTRQDDDSLYQQAHAWARLHAYELGLDPSVPIAIRGVHVAYRQAADHQPRPEIVLQLTQRRRDLEDPALDEDERPKFRAGTTVIAGVDGRVDFVVAKPFPFVDAAAVQALPADSVAHRHHEAGEERLAKLRDWIDTMDRTDALGVWTDEPAVNRLDLAALHGDEVGRARS
jgi:hypothetical protein